MKVKEDITVKPPLKLEEILSWAKGFVKLEEENSHHWGNVSKGKDLCKETIKRMERNRSMAWDPKYQMQRSKVHDKVGTERNEPQMVKALRSYNPRGQVVTEISQGPYLLAIPYT